MTAATKTIEQRKIKARRVRLAAVPYLLLLPAMLAMAAVSLYPMIDGARASLHKYRYGIEAGYTGVENFRNIYNDAVFWQAVETTIRFILIAVSIETVLGLLLALLVARELRFCFYRYRSWDCGHASPST